MLSRHSEVKVGDIGGVEEYAPYTVGSSRSQGDWVSSEGIAQFEGTALEGDLALILNSTNQVARSVFRRLKSLRKGLVAELISIGWGLQVQGVVGTLQVIDRSPVIESSLALCQVREVPAL